MMRDLPSTAPIVKNQHADLATTYELHAPKIEQIWRDFDQNQRAEIFMAGITEHLYLNHSKDRSLGNAWMIVPEMNLHDITTGPDFLLDYLKHRGTTTLLHQYKEGINGGPGDCDFIFEIMRVNKLRQLFDFGYSYIRFYNDKLYGDSFGSRDADEHRKITTKFAFLFQSKAMVLREVGEFILTRQLITLSFLNCLIADILDIDSTTNKSLKPLSDGKSIYLILSCFSALHHQEKSSLDDMINSAFDQKASLNEYFELCCSEPVVLKQAFNTWFYSRPELVPDKRGRIFPVLGYNYINTSIFELIHNIATGVATWDYLHRLLKLLAGGPDDKVANTILLQEISNVAHLELCRVQNFFKRCTAIDAAPKYFKRVSGQYDDGNAQILLKQDPKFQIRESPQLSYLLHLCTPDLNINKAVIWIKKFDDFHRLHPTERNEVPNSVLDAFGDLAGIIGFVQALFDTIDIPPKSPSRGQIYASRLNKLLGELAPLKNEVDLSEFAVPIENLLKPGMIEGAIHALDQFMAEHMGAKTGFLYQDLVEECVSQIQVHCAQQKDRVIRMGNNPLRAFEDPAHEVLAPDMLLRQRRQKDRARRTDSSPYNLTQKATEPIKVGTLEPPQVFKVNKYTAQVFLAIFSKSEPRGSVSWAAFKTAMTDLKFSVISKFGSVFTFFPTEDVGAKNSITFRRPHNSEIEGWELIMIASRLKRVYGWSEGSFEVI